MNETTIAGRSAIRSIAVALGGGGLAEPQIALHAWNGNLVREVEEEARALAAVVSLKMDPTDQWSVGVSTTKDGVTRIYVELDPDAEDDIDRALTLLERVASEYR